MQNKKFNIILLVGWVAMALFSCSDDAFSVLENDIATIDSELGKAGITAVQDPSGVRIQYLVRNENGRTPTTQAIVEVDYEGKLFLDGATFDEGEQIDLEMWQMIQGFQLGLQLMREGETAVIYIPSSLAYGSTGSGNIPPNSIIQFEVTLYDLK